ncbi:CDC45-like protein [Irpex lacteus]|nr:CDC45-like protein [Irpex lacteus]
MYLPPPHLALPNQDSYGEAYAKILARHRRSPLTSASSVIILVAPDVDALCAARMLAELLKQDDVMYRIIPIAGPDQLMRQKNEFADYQDLHTLILINMGAMYDLTKDDWFAPFNTNLHVHVIDSSRPLNLENIFMEQDVGERIVIWDDGGVEKLTEERRAYNVITYEPEPASDEDSELEDDGLDEDEEGEEDEYEEGSSTGKRRSLNSGRPSRKRRKADKPQYTPRDERDRLRAILNRHSETGTSHAQSASGTIYLLATVLERTDTDLLWLAILGLTYQYTTSRISRSEYDKFHVVYHDEVARLRPPLPSSSNNASSDYSEYKAQNPDDRAIFATDEWRFMLFRHWNLYDAMYHSKKGRKRLTGLLAKMGFSVTETQQSYSHMAKDLKLTLRTKLAQIAPEYGLLELSYPSFARACGYVSQPISAGDAVEGISALLDLAEGTKMEVEVEGARNGGEWFGGGRAWDAGRNHGEDDKENKNMLARGVGGGQGKERERDVNGEREEEGEEGKGESEWWVRNFWTAYDALDDIFLLKKALPLSMALHRAIIRTGTSIIDKQDIKSFRGHRVVVLTQGPDLPLFAHPAVLSRLALWLVEALRDKVAEREGRGGGGEGGRRRRKSLPFIVCCLNERRGAYTVVGVTAATDFGQVRKNEFGFAFIEAQAKCNAQVRYTAFDTSVIEIHKDDLVDFLNTLCEGAR